MPHTYGYTNLIALNNIDVEVPVGHPVYYLTQGTLASGPDFYVEILGGPVGGPLLPVVSVGLGHPTSFSLFDGVFDAGIGVVPSVPADGYADFIVRAWHGAATFEGAPERVQLGLLTNVKLGDTDGLGLPNPSPFPFPSDLVILPVPEPWPLALGAMGLLLLIVRRYMS